jgi:hypothetical protein
MRRGVIGGVLALAKSDHYANSPKAPIASVRLTTLAVTVAVRFACRCYVTQARRPS